MVLILTVLLLLQLRPVQTFLAKKAVEKVTIQTNHSISINKVRVSWLDRAIMESLLIRDIEGDTLLYAKEFKVNYSISDLTNGDYLSAQEIDLRDVRVKLIKRDSTSKLNISEFLDSLKKDTTKKESKPLYVEEINLTDFHLSIDDRSKVSDYTRLDFSNMDLDIPSLNVSSLGIVSDTINANIINMSAVEKNSGFIISEFSTSLRLSNQSLSVDDLNFRTPTSNISDSLEFFYNGLENLSNFKDSVSFILHFENSRISRDDLKILLGEDIVKEDITIDGIIWGTVGDFNIEETRVGYGKSYFLGGVSCFGLPNLKETFILADLTDSHLLPGDLRSYIGDYADNLNQMGRIDFTGSFAGFLNDFVARGDFVTDQGSVHTDINLKIPENANDMSYEGNLEFRKVNVGAFFQNEIAQIVNLTAAIKGKGIQAENAEFDLEALVYNSGLKGYVYDSVEVDGQFAKNFFKGEFAVKDPNCELKGVAEVDFRQTQDVLSVKMDVSGVDVGKLGLIDNDLSARGKLNLEVKDIDIDNFSGKLSLYEGLISIGEREIILDSVRVSSTYVDSVRSIDLIFPGFESKLEGKFKISSAILDIPAMANSYASELRFKDDSVKTKSSGDGYRLSFEAEIGDVSSYIDSLDLPFSLGSKTLVETTFRQSKNTNISIFVESDTISFGSGTLYGTVLEINGSRDIESSDILTNFILESPKQVIEGMPDTENLLLEGVWYDDEIGITTHVGQSSTASDVRIESNIKLYEDSLILHMLPSDIKLLNDEWTFNPTNKIVISKEKTTVSNLEIYDSSESVAIDGVYADSIPTSINISTEDLNMNKVSLFSDSHIGGFLNGNFRMFRQNSEEALKFDGAFLIKNLVFDEFKVGDINGSSVWNPDTRSVFTKVEVERENVNAIEVEGFYFPSAKDEQLDFDITFDDADLKMGEPFLKENFSDIEGVTGGTLSLSGTIAKPKVVGKCVINDGGVTINYLNTHYTYSGEIIFNPGSIQLSDFHLIDRKGSDALVSGSINHSFFQDLLTDISIRANNFEFLNTTILDNNLYYGSAYGTGIIDVKGPLNDLNIKAEIKTEADTRFFVPVSDGTTISQEEYITFVDFNDTTTFETEEDFKISGLTLDFDIEVTPDAYCELIFDIKSGDIIRGRGRGNLNLRLDTDGDFSMFGPLEIEEGAYNFTVSNLLSKEFDVIPGSRITWYGDPYNATIDLDATYLQRASFEGLQNPDRQNQDDLTRKVPILVVLELEGGMLTPQIEFDIQLQNQSDATNENIPALSQIRNDEQELKRQVISLLILKRFSPKESFTLSGGGGVGNSVSEVISGQVSYLVSQIDENLEVEVDLANLDDEAFNTFQLRLAYTFLNGRLKVTRGGDFGSQDDTNSNVLNDLVGDWSVEYSLTKDGRLRAKVFSNSDQRIQVNENQQNQELGISLRFVHSFNDITELLTLKREEILIRRKEEEDEKGEEGEQSESKNESTGIR